MKQPHATAQLLRDLKAHIKSVNQGSEPFASGLKSVSDAGWDMLNLRDIDWAAIGPKNQFLFRVRTFAATTDGLEETYATPVKEILKPKDTPYQASVRRHAVRTLLSFEKLCTWISGQFADALNSGELNGRSQLRCLKGHAAHIALSEKRLSEVRARMSGRVMTGDQRLASFVARHGKAFLYRDQIYPTKEAALGALEADTKAVPVDHDYVVLLFEDAFPHGGTDERKLAVLESYLRSKDHKDARSLSPAMTKKASRRYDRTLQMVLSAERRLAPLDDPLPPSLHIKLGVSKTFLTNLMSGKVRNKVTVRTALRERLYQMSPQRRPRGKRKEKA